MTKKDVKKIIRGILQMAVLLTLLFIWLITFLDVVEYVPYEEGEYVTGESDTGFISISYFGTSRMGTDINISTKRLDEHLESLYNNGYVTITQQDVIDYYEEGKVLPEKSLFLMFEDGYAGTSIFAEEILHKYNFIATMVSYGNNLEANDLGLLDGEDLKELGERSFWEVGTNGYRLAYINVFDEDDNYLGEMDALTFSANMDIIEDEYNHYLMDFIRDDYGVPKESARQMQERIDQDYRYLEEAFETLVGELPRLHVLMHANTDAFGNHRKASAVNEENIKAMFDINFNREGYSLNTRENSIYDLTRMQGQAYWYPNHLLMRIKHDVDQEIVFEVGDEEKVKEWTLENGAVEIREEVIALTTEPSGTGRIRLNNPELERDFSLSTILSGNMVGYQNIYLRSDDALSSYIKVRVGWNRIQVSEAKNGAESVLWEEKIDPDLEDEDIEVKNLVDYALELRLEEGNLEVIVDGVLMGNIEVSQLEEGGIALESQWLDGEGFRNIYDDVYDGAFEQLTITNLDEEVLYTSEYTEFQKFVKQVKDMWDEVVNWFIEAL